jgi:hypothetical protein
VEAHSLSYIQPDIQPFKDTTGKVIEGRRQWREHLKATDAVEMSKGDLEAQREAQEKKKREHLAKVEKQAKLELKTEWQEPKEVESDPTSHKRLWAKVAERLEGREQPTRKQLLRIVIEEAKRAKRR